MEILERTLAYEAYTFLRQQHPFHSTIWLHDGFWVRPPPPPPVLVTTMPIRTIPFYFILTDLPTAIHSGQATRWESDRKLDWFVSN